MCGFVDVIGNVRELRHAEPGLSQEKLAARAGFHRTYVGKLERGETATTVDSLAHYVQRWALPCLSSLSPSIDSPGSEDRAAEAVPTVVEGS